MQNEVSKEFRLQGILLNIFYAFGIIKHAEVLK